MTTHVPIPILTSIAPLAPEADAWLCDVWGVVHDGVAALPPAVDACQRFRARGGIVVLITNAPRPAAAVATQLTQLGVPHAAYDAILTSGDLARALIAARRGEPLLHTGPIRDKGLFAGLETTFVEADAAKLIVCSGLFDDETETPDDYRARFESLVARNVPMICANPDITVARGERIVYCAGALAALYEEIGGAVIYAGKPHRPIYDRAEEIIAECGGRTVPRERILAIGDGIRTDICGAIRAGLRAVFVASAIHVSRPLEAAALEHLFAGVAERPIAAMPQLAW